MLRLQNGDSTHVESVVSDSHGVLCFPKPFPITFQEAELEVCIKWLVWETLLAIADPQREVRNPGLLKKVLAHAAHADAARDNQLRISDDQMAERFYLRYVYSNPLVGREPSLKENLSIQTWLRTVVAGMATANAKHEWHWWEYYENAYTASRTNIVRNRR